MNKIKLAIFSVAALMLVVAFFNADKIRAYYYDEEDEEKEVYIVKRVSRPRTNNEGSLDFHFDLGEGEDDRYQKDQIVVFEIKVKNTGDETINKIVVRDAFPQYIDFPSDNDSNWDEGKREYHYEIFDLKPGEESTRQIEGRVTTDSRVCVVNKVWAEPEGADSDFDDAQLCIGKEGEVLGVKSMPETGSNLLLISLFTGAVGTGALVGKKKKN